MKIAIVGLGAVGTHLAAHLASVPELAVSALLRDGPTGTMPVRVGLPAGERRGEIRVSAAPRELGPQDAVFVTVKSQQLRDVAPAVAQLLGPQSVVVPPSSTIPYWYFHGLAGYGPAGEETLDPDGGLAHCMPVAQAIGCAFWVGATLVARGNATQEGAVAGYPLGEPDGSRSERVLRLAAALERAGLRAPVRADIRAEIWMKLINSLCWNSLAVLTCAEMTQLGSERRVVDLARRMMEEAERVAACFGARMPVPTEQRIATALRAAGHRMSSLQDLRAGRPLELDLLVDSFARMRSLAAIPTPLIDDVTGLAALRSRTLAMEQQR